MIKVPPCTKKIMVVPHKVKGICEDVLSGWIVWSSSILTGSIGGSLTFGMGFNRSLELVIDVRYP